MCGCASLQMGRCNVLISYLLCHIHIAIDPVGIQRSVETTQQPTVKSHRDESVPRSGKIPITVGAAYGRTRAGTNYPRRGLRTARGKNETSSKPQAIYSTRSGLREHPAPSPHRLHLWLFDLCRSAANFQLHPHIPASSYPHIR